MLPFNMLSLYFSFALHNLRRDFWVSQEQNRTISLLFVKQPLRLVNFILILST